MSGSTIGEEVHPIHLSLSIIGRGKACKPTTTTTNRSAHRPRRKTSNNNMHTQAHHAHRRDGSLTGRHYPHQRTPTPPGHPQGHSPLSCACELPTQRETRERWARRIPGVTDDVTMTRHVTAFERWNATNQRTGKTGLSSNRKHIPPALRPGKFGRATEELGCTECFPFRQDANQFKPSISSSTANLTRKDHELNFPSR